MRSASLVVGYGPYVFTMSSTVIPSLIAYVASEHHVARARWNWSQTHSALLQRRRSMKAFGTYFGEATR